MPTIEYEGRKIDVDEEGYLVSFEDWDEKVACVLADREGIAHKCPLIEERMEILRYMRDYYKKFNAFPIVRAVCVNVHQPRDCEYVQFPDPIKAWKIAGLPKPATQVIQNIKHE